MNRFFRGFDYVLKFFFILAGILIIYMMLSVCWDVVVRYIFNRPSLWVVDVASFALLFLTFLVAAWVLKRDGHVRMELIVDRLNPRDKLLVNGIMSVIAAVVFLLMTWYSANEELVLYQTQFQVNSVTRPLKYLIYFIIPLGSFLVSIQLVRIAINCFVKIRESLPH